MNKNKKRIIICIVSIILILLATIIMILTSSSHYKSKLLDKQVIENIEKNETENLEEKYIQIDEKLQNETTEQEIEEIESLKQEQSITGDTNIYEVQKEYDGRKVLTIKGSVKYKVAFAGMIKGSTPSLDELDTILTEKLPNKYGIWIEENSREKILNYINNYDKINSQYYIDDEGYLKIKQVNNQTEIDKEISNVINGEKQYILTISSVCYIVDDITGEILDYNFENIDNYQTYEYFDDDDKTIIFITENNKKLLDENEIIESIINLIIQI